MGLLFLRRRIAQTVADEKREAFRKRGDQTVKRQFPVWQAVRKKVPDLLNGLPDGFQQEILRQN